MFLVLILVYLYLKYINFQLKYYFLEIIYLMTVN